MSFDPAMKRFFLIAILALNYGGQGFAADQEVTDIRAVHRHGQTFITWKDAAEGADGAKYRYSLYRSEHAITADNLDKAERCYYGASLAVSNGELFLRTHKHLLCISGNKK